MIDFSYFFLNRCKHLVQETYEEAAQSVLLPVPAIPGRVDLHGYRLPRSLRPTLHPGQVRAACQFSQERVAFIREKGATASRLRISSST